MRGLKQFPNVGQYYQIEVASFTDAWIETGSIDNNVLTIKSHLLQMRGLKLSCYQVTIRASMSHLLQMRGLKHFQ